jgi:hypothetical protein
MAVGGGDQEPQFQAFPLNCGPKEASFFPHSDQVAGPHTEGLLLMSARPYPIDQTL